MMESLRVLADVWMPLLITHMIEISLFIALVWFTDRVVSLSTGVRYVLWLLALIKVCIPPLIFISPLGITKDIISESEAVAPLALDVLKFGSITAEIVAEHQIGMPVIFGVWLSATMFMASIVVLSNIRMHRRLQGGRLITSAIPELSASAWPPRLQVFSLVSIRASLLIGPLRPRLYLPDDWSKWTSEQRRSILAHELAHYHNRDLWVLGVQTLALIVFPLNPFIWLLNSKLSHIREIRCDETAARSTQISPTEYAKMLCACLERRPHRILPVTAGSFFSRNTSAVFSRIHHLLQMPNRKTVSRPRHMVVVATVALAVIPLSMKFSGADPPLSSEPDAVTESEQSVVFEIHHSDGTPMKVVVIDSDGTEGKTYDVPDGVNAKLVVSKLDAELKKQGGNKQSSILFVPPIEQAPRSPKSPVKVKPAPPSVPPSPPSL